MRRETLYFLMAMTLMNYSPVDFTGSLSVLLYASPALTFQYKQISELNACWNSVIRRIFGYQRSESVKAVIHGLGRVNVKFQLLLHRVKFYKRLYLKSDLLHNVFWVYLLTVA